MEDIQSLSIDIMDDKVFDPIYTKQYDQGRKVYITITKDGKAISLNGIIASFQMKKPDGTVILKNCTISDNKVIVDLDRNITVQYGNRIPFQIQLLQGKTIISTTTGILTVDKSVVQMDDIESSSDFTTFSDILINISEKYEETKDYAEQSKSYLEQTTALYNSMTTKIDDKIQLMEQDVYDKLSEQDKQNGTLYLIK